MGGRNRMECDYRFLEQMDVEQLQTVYNDSLQEARDRIETSSNIGEKIFPTKNLTEKSGLIFEIKELDAKASIVSDVGGFE